MQSPYASFSSRAFARFIDLIVVLLPFVAFYLIDRLLGSPIKYKSVFTWRTPESATMFMTDDFAGLFTIFVTSKLLVAFPYFSMMESSRWQGTLGKQAMQIKVAGTDGKRISFARASGRYFLKIISSTEFMLGYIIAFSDQRQTLHDYLSQTLVVRKDVVFSDHYLMPREPSRFLFGSPGSLEENYAGYECMWCDHRGNERSEYCPNCRRTGYPPVRVLYGTQLLGGFVFVVIGIALAYVTFWVVSDRIVDYTLRREGTPWPVIALIVASASVCLFGGISSIAGKKWLLRLLIWITVGFGQRT